LYLKSLPDQEGRLPAVADLNIGAEVHLVKNLSVWLQMNNLLNQTYQRWNNYQQLGFQVLGGIKLTFDQKQ
jgi:outer membrane cobalamin receptor